MKIKQAVVYLLIALFTLGTLQGCVKTGNASTKAFDNKGSASKSASQVNIRVEIYQNDKLAVAQDYKKLSPGNCVGMVKLEPIYWAACLEKIEGETIYLASDFCSHQTPTCPLKQRKITTDQPLTIIAPEPFKNVKAIIYWEK